jgi:hypothetical protein
MALTVVRKQDFTVIQALTNFSLQQQAYLAKRGTAVMWGVQFADENGEAFVYPEGTLITLGLKGANPNNTVLPGTIGFDGPYILSGSTMSAPDENGIYWILISFTGDPLNTALGYNPPTVNDDVASVTLYGEVRLDIGGITEKSINNFQLIIYHDINTGTEETASAAVPPWIPNWSFITALAGGGISDLDYQPTRGVAAAGMMVALCGIAALNGGGLTIWQLQARTDATAAGLQRPLDYDAATNAVVWTKIL